MELSQPWPIDAVTASVNLKVQAVILEVVSIGADVVLEFFMCNKPVWTVPPPSGFPFRYLHDILIFEVDSVAVVTFIMKLVQKLNCDMGFAWPR